MATMVRMRLAAAFALLLAVTGGAGEGPRRLSHRVWLLGGVPDEGALTNLRAAGVTGVVLPVGRVELGEGSCRFTLAQPADLSALAGWPVTTLVWVEGSGKASGDPESFTTQFTPVQRGVTKSEGLLLISRRFFPGLSGFATGVAARLHRPVEVALPAQDDGIVLQGVVKPDTCRRGGGPAFVRLRSPSGTRRRSDFRRRPCRTIWLPSMRWTRRDSRTALLSWSLRGWSHHPARAEARSRCYRAGKQRLSTRASAAVCFASANLWIGVACRWPWGRA